MKHTIRKILMTILSVLCVCTMLFAVACGEEKKTNENSSEPTVSSSVEDSSEEQSSEEQSSEEQSSQEQSSQEQSSQEQSSSSGGGEEQQPVELPAAPNYSNDVNANVIIGAYDGGPAVEKVILTFPNSIPASAVETRSLVVSWGGNMGNASTDKIYLCNKNGRKVNGLSSKNVAIEYAVSYSGYGFGNNLSPFSYANNYNSWKSINSVSLTMNNFNVEGNVYTRFTGTLNVTKSVPSLEKWDITGDHVKDGVHIKYGKFEPEVPAGEKRPLIIWLHGQGEGNTAGGNDPSIALLGNKVTPLAEDPIQSYFNGAFVLAPQAPTMWMDTITGTFPNSAYEYDTKSKYFDALEDLIRTYVAGNDKIDAKRVYVGGCSNGGWCTLELVSRMGNFFAACYPVCAPYAKAHFTDERFANLVSVPMWIIASNDDTTVNNNGDSNQSINVDGIAHSKRLYIDLLEAGKTDLYFSLFANVTADGISYMGHFSWIYVFRDEVKYVQTKPANGAEFNKSQYNTGSRLTAKYNDNDVNMWQWLSTFKNDGTRVDPIFPQA